jgi:Tfp pilus assembly protein PilV
MNIVNKKILNQNGLTFIEVIVALGVLLTAIISGLTLTTFNLNSSIASENRLLAANLGREAIEVIREKRDSNWLASTAWNSGLLQDPVNIYRLTANFDPDANVWSTLDQTYPIISCSACTLYYNPDNGVFSHDSLPPNQATTFKRLVTINEICWQQAVGNETILADGLHCSDEELIGWQLTAELTWRDNNINHQMQLVDRIYDWR